MNGLTLGVLTSSDKRIETLLQQYGIANMFASIVHAELVTNHKPHPEGLELAAAQMGIDTWARDGRRYATRYFGGKNAGALASVGVTHGF